MRVKEIVITVGLIGAAAVTAWQSSTPAPLMSTGEGQRVETSVNYAGCHELRASGKAPLYAGQPGYREGMDGDHDGIACEPNRGR